MAQRFVNEVLEDNQNHHEPLEVDVDVKIEEQEEYELPLEPTVFVDYSQGTQIHFDLQNIYTSPTN